jgi:F-type H+-transporting ATPase subunit alpha
LLQDEIGCVLLDSTAGLHAGTEVRRTGRVFEVPVGPEVLGRVIDPVGRPLDHRGAMAAEDRRTVDRDAPAIMDRAPVTVPLQTGLKVIDALIPIGRGQRELILGDRQTGKTSIAIDTILNQRDQDIVCVYCAIGQRSTSVARVIDTMRQYGALDYCVIVVAEADAPPGIQYIAPYAATTIGEFFMERGRDVVVVYDDLTAHARAYRELSLLLRRPPGREAFPGDIFYIHSRLLERATHLADRLGGGSLTALPIAETEAQNVSAYIPTNLISITDGQIYLSPDLFRKGVLPAVDVGRSVSRVGGKTQLPAYRTVAGRLRLSYSQFEELERFARFTSQLDNETLKALNRGARVRATLMQTLHNTLAVPEQLAELIAVTTGVFDQLEINQVQAAADRVRGIVRGDLPDLCDQVLEGQPLGSEQIEQVRSLADQVLQAAGKSNDGNA